MQVVLACLTLSHDQNLLWLAVIICVIGVYASFSVASQTSRCQGNARIKWASISIVSAGCTAWATHMTGLLAFQPGMTAGFEPRLTALSLLTAIAGIGAGMALAIGRRGHVRRFLAGVVLGSGVVTLHYIGQVAYIVTGEIVWNTPLVAASVLASLALFGGATVAAGGRSRPLRKAGAPLLLAAIAVLHFCGMAAATLVFDPRRELPSNALPPEVIAPIVASVSLGLLALAVIGLRMTLAAKAQACRDQQRLRELANLAVEGLAICEGEIIMTANQSLERLSGIDQADLVGRRLSSLFPNLTVSALPEREEHDTELIGVDGLAVPVRVLRSEVMLGSALQTVLAVRDQRERLRTEAEMRTLAFSDALTGLPNRTRFNTLVALHAASQRQRDQLFAILLIDLDRFKLVNDTLGHGTGDALLRKVAVRLQSAAGPQDIVARLGGDEFAVLQLDASREVSPETLASRIVELIGRPFLVEGQLINVGASVGVALGTEDGEPPDRLLRNADLAVYKAKAEGKGAFRMYEPGLDAHMQARRALEADMRRALAVQEFELHYQPLVDARSGRVTSAEALVRWRHPDRGLVSPAEFIPLAEETGLIGPLGQWVLRTACAHAACWPGDIRVAVNLSPAQFRDLQLADTVRVALADGGLPAHRLELEITEGVLLSDEGQIMATLARLKLEGIGIAMDDFGTGYSSLGYLRRFPFDKIKVDQSFVKQLPGDAESAAIVRAIITMGKCLGMAITVEGVETAEQFAFTAREGCDQVQGYHVSRPMPLDDFLSFVQARRAA